MTQSSYDLFGFSRRVFYFLPDISTNFRKSYCSFCNFLSLPPFLEKGGAKNARNEKFSEFVRFSRAKL